MVQAKNYKNKDEVIADFKKAFARKREWLRFSRDSSETKTLSRLTFQFESLL